MPDYSANSKRLVKNTLVLYVRMLVMMVITLYTSRVVLNVLGVEDYGIYNLVGGVVSLFSAVSTTLNVAINRFITYELGKGDKDNLKKVFSTSVNIQLIVIVIFLLIAETIGLWYLNNKMVIPQDRLNAANWCFQFSIITFAINLISVPYNSAIIAHERMSAFAYIAIIESVGKLVIAWAIMITSNDKLIVYSLYMVVFAFIIRTIYVFYCKRHFEECTYHLVFESDMMKQMFGFVGWAFIGVTSWALQTYGFVVLINLFFGPVVNAAYAIAVQVQSAIVAFTNNFMMALNPQITKAYAANNKEYMFKLIFQGARFSAYIMLILALPIFFNTHYILLLWLKQVPEHTVLFVQLIIVLSMFSCLSGTLTTAQIAYGKIRNYQLVVSPIGLLNIPISYLLYSMGFSPETILVVAIVLSQAALIASLVMLRGMIGISISQYLKNVYLNVFIVALVSLIIPLYLSFYLDESFLHFFQLTIVSVFCTLLAVLYMGLKDKERKMVYNKISLAAKKIYGINNY